MLAKLRRMQFGRRFEKLDLQIEQLKLKLKDLEAEAAVAEAQAPVEIAPRRKAKRKPLPAHLPCEERVLRPDLDVCPAAFVNEVGLLLRNRIYLVPEAYQISGKFICSGGGNNGCLSLSASATPCSTPKVSY